MVFRVRKIQCTFQVRIEPRIRCTSWNKKIHFFPGQIWEKHIFPPPWKNVCLRSSLCLLGTLHNSVGCCRLPSPFLLCPSHPAPGFSRFFLNTLTSCFPNPLMIPNAMEIKPDNLGPYQKNLFSKKPLHVTPSATPMQPHFEPVSLEGISTLPPPMNPFPPSKDHQWKKILLFKSVSRFFCHENIFLPIGGIVDK